MSSGGHWLLFILAALTIGYIIMNSAMTYKITTSSSEATKSVARHLSKFLSGGEVIELASDLGGGKTTFVQGLAAGLGYKGAVTSPTFALINIYRLPSKLELHHYDLYRLGESGILAEELAEDLGQAHIITVIEWAGIARHQLPADRIIITIKPSSETERQLTFTGGGPTSSYIIESLKA